MKAVVTVAMLCTMVAAAAGGWWVWRQGGTDAEAVAERRFVTPERRSIAASVLATGVVRLRVGGEVRVGAQLSGIVEKLNVEVGSKVKRATSSPRSTPAAWRRALPRRGRRSRSIEQEVRRAEVELDARGASTRRSSWRKRSKMRRSRSTRRRALLEKARRDACRCGADRPQPTR
jgi:multidrug efflux pump subunit AcrA (membrane-fusion protein)